MLDGENIGCSYYPKIFTFQQYEGVKSALKKKQNLTRATRYWNSYVIDPVDEHSNYYGNKNLNRHDNLNWMDWKLITYNDLT